MRKISAAFLIFVAIVAAGGWWTRETGAGSAYAEAENRIAAAIAEDARVLHLNGLHDLHMIPVEISSLKNLVMLNLRGSRISDITDLVALPSLQILNLNGTQVTDLKGISGLLNLEILDVGDTWVSDLAPLVDLPKLKRLDVGGTQLRTLEPATRMGELTWINLHGTYALDGSKVHFDALKSMDVDVNNGRAIREDYRPDWIHRSKVRIDRALDRLGLVKSTR